MRENTNGLTRKGATKKGGRMPPPRANLRLSASMADVRTRRQEHCGPNLGGSGGQEEKRGNRGPHIRLVLGNMLSKGKT